MKDCSSILFSMVAHEKAWVNGIGWDVGAAGTDIFKEFQRPMMGSWS